jgi:uncharacterized cupin superfamily protein
MRTSRHRNEDEIVYVLDGELTYYLGEQEHRARVGSCLFLPRGGEHGFVVETQEAHLLTLVLPARLDGYYLELDEAGREGGVTLERLVTVAARYGVEITGPPFGTAQRTTAASKVDRASKPGRRKRT